ncbi:MAG TPA: AraC family transcriptional regulator [Candidatus Binataceae bacterium]|nr:AraC family transcriptional regulator [Candidatus Binataceae bacterium]
MDANSDLPDPSPQWREVVRDGLVRVREYRCAACAGDPPQDDQFGQDSIAIVRSGVFEVRSAKRSELLTTGFLLLGNAGQHYEVSHEHAGADTCLVFNFAAPVLDEIAGAVRRGAMRRLFAINVLAPRPRADAIMRRAERSLRPGASAMGLEELGLALAEYVLGEAGTGAARAAGWAPENPRAREQVLAAIAEIENRAHEDLDLAGLAQAVNASPFHLVRIFKRETGVTPYRFLLQTRIRNAIEFLNDTDAPITDIAFDVGFGDLSNFINAFRREVGCSPREYRKSGLGPRPTRSAARRRIVQVEE